MDVLMRVEGQAAMLGIMEDIAELTYTHHLMTFVSSPAARGQIP